MAWLDNIIKRLPDVEMQVINDAKSPSGQPHVGSLRGILVHDAAYRFLKSKNIPVKYIYGSDDYDPFDALPPDYPKDIYEKMLGIPLCNIPIFGESEHKDVAMHFISDFFKIFDELNVDAEKYYMRDYYVPGKFNESIDKILSQVESIRKIYLDVSNSVRSKDWYPFQVVCEKCGKLGSTEVTGYDGKEVTYTCHKDLVSWATGCGHTGKISPFDGNGKLPYKVEWAVKWKEMGITIEGAGKDHNTRGGSRDVANAISRQILNYQPPVNIPYEFFNFGSQKMSSSGGIGVSARAMTDFLPPEILRYLMLAPQPKKVVSFEPSERNITKLFNDFDRLHRRVYSEEGVKDFEKLTYDLSQVFVKENYWTADFTLITTFLQLPHINIYEQCEKLKGSVLTEAEKTNLTQRAKSGQYWLNNFATEDEKITIQENLPEKANELNVVQRGFLRNYLDLINKSDWTDKSIQSAIFAAVRITPIDNKEGFKAVYRVLLDKEKGPKVGNLIAYMEKDFIAKRFTELDFDKVDFWNKTAITQADFDKWKSSNEGKIVSMEENSKFDSDEKIEVLEITATLDDGKTYMNRILK